MTSFVSNFSTGEADRTYHLVDDAPGNPAAAGRSITLNHDGSFIYTAPDNLPGDWPVTDWFTYYSSDSEGRTSGYATQVVKIMPVKASLSWDDQTTFSNPNYAEILEKKNGTALTFRRMMSINSELSRFPARSHASASDRASAAEARWPSFVAYSPDQWTPLVPASDSVSVVPSGFQP